MRAYHLIGLMSGTSLDGIDLCYVKFEQTDRLNYELIYTKAINYAPEMLTSLKSAESLSALAMAKLDTELGRLYGEEINTFIKENNIKDIDGIASHGHTIFHHPELNFSTQIGSPAQINAITSIKTIADFRSIDTALGGHGAPLVPIGDLLLFGKYDNCLNLGGIANVSYREPETRNSIAFDIVICNMALNHMADLFGKPYDDNGQIASEGKVISTLLEALNSFEYLLQPPPKSLGKEQFHSFYLPLIENYLGQNKNIMATLIEHIGIQIGGNLKPGSCLITGGGAYNGALIDAIKRHSTCEIEIPSNEIIEFKEAIVFGLLGYLKLTNRINTLSSVTGAKRDSIGGCVYG
jgi:anhydro-N-acetylmuramic acid kinase